MDSRALTAQDRPQLDALLMRDPVCNVFHLSAMLEYEKAGYPGGLSDAPQPEGGPWAVGVFRDGELVGMVTAVKGTGGIYHSPGDREVLKSVAELVVEKARQGALTLLSGHSSQVGVLLPLVDAAGVGPSDNCHFRTLEASQLLMPPLTRGYSAPFMASVEDMERLIDFYETGFYSLARLPSRAAWRNRLTEQLAYRTLYMIEDAQGRVVSAALSSAEAAGVAMLGGVATLSAHRGKGLSALCVGALCKHLLDKGFHTVALFYLEDNDSAGRVYQKLGFQEAGHWLLAPLGIAASFAPLFTLRTT
ncbi:MAG: GNAT family N-acetyltransferase [Chloroflexota bacterium]|nr:GNAT family N-acetyltransferase [Chloroflexota bacterium]